MDRGYQEDYDEYMPMKDFSDGETKSLPPRSVKHGIKPIKKHSNILQMLTGSLIFIIIISISVYVFMSLSDDNEAESFDVIPNTTAITEDSNSNQQLNNSDSDVVALETSEDLDQNTNENTDENSTSVRDYEGETIHIVKSGENLFRISILYYNSGEYYEALAKYNGLDNAGDIYVGMKLKIPSKEELMNNQ